MLSRSSGENALRGPIRAVGSYGILRLRACFAPRSSHSAQDDSSFEPIPRLQFAVINTALVLADSHRALRPA